MNFPVKFEFQLLDEQGNPSTVFEEGENFILSFSIINPGSETVYLKQNSLNTDNFLRVYKISESSEGTGKIDMGKPYEGVFCLEHYGGGYPIAPESSLDIEISWSTEKGDYLQYHDPFCWGAEAELLKAGEYLTSFENSFQFSKDGKAFTTDTLHFDIYFEIK